MDSIEAYECKPHFSLLSGKYWSKVQTVSEKKFCFDLKMSVGGFFFS